MKATFTQNRTVKTNRISIRRVFILLVICLFVPGCMNHAENCGSCLPKGEIAFFAANIASDGANNQIDASATDAGNDMQKKVSTTDNTANDAGQNTLVPINHTNHMPEIDIDIEQGIDPHVNNEEENVMNITLKAIMRIAIMVLLVIIIV